MPRSRTRARIRAAQLAAGLIPRQPDWTPGRIGHLLRKIWKRFAMLEKRRHGADEPLARPRRRQAIAAAMDKWGSSLPKWREEPEADAPRRSISPGPGGRRA